jgi:hypothetical protein
MCVPCFLCRASAIPALAIGNHCGRQSTLTWAFSYNVIGIIPFVMSGLRPWIKRWASGHAANSGRA